MTSTTDFSPLLWFIAIIVMIPIALWLLKRTPVGGGSAHGLMRNIAMLPLSPNQRLLMVEVGSADERRWLVLGVTAQSITTLHAMAPQDEVVAPAAAGMPPVPFAQLLTRLRQGRGSPGDR